MLKLKSKMDLIKIYQKGQWEEFLLEYEIYCNEKKELDELIGEFIDDYFIEYNFSPMLSKKVGELYKKKYIESTGDDENVGSKEWFFRYSDWEENFFYNRDASQLPYKEFLGEDYKSPTNVMSDSRLERLEYLSNKWLVRNKYAEKMFKWTYLDSEFPLDAERLEFAEKYLKRRVLKIEFDNTIEEAIDYGYADVVDFAKNNENLQRNFYGNYSLYKYLAKKLKRIRLNSKLSIKELSEKLNIDSGDLKKIESTGKNINLELLIKYANIFDIKLDEIIAHNNVMEELIRRQYEEEHRFDYMFGRKIKRDSEDL